ncbi:MAG: hypothetical protein ACT443_12635 [Gemmatimonadota bacterium]
MRSSQLVRLLALVALTACIDGTGPRPRPDGMDDGNGPPGGNPPELLWWELQPRVIEHGSTDSATLRVTIAGNAQSVSVQLRTGAPVTLRPISANQYSASLPIETLLFGYRTGDLHSAAGVIEAANRDGADSVTLIVNVHDATVDNPLASFTSISPTMQASDHVVNMRHDAMNPGQPVSEAVLRTFYERFPDDYNFVAIVEQIHSKTRPFYTGVRNAITGIGLNRFDNGAAFGSAARLEGIVQYPVDADLDLARTDNLHELGHRWINYLSDPLLARARPHWPLSTMANGVVGWADPVTGEALPFPFELSPNPNGTYSVSVTATPRSFNSLELYLMGLLAPDSVRAHVVFANQNQRAELRRGGTLSGGVDSVTIGEIIAREGSRVPRAADAPRSFRMATIVLSRGGLLSRDELAFFEHVAARGEQRVQLFYSDGFVRTFTLPFFLATGRRASLTTRLLDAPL